jgi:hypothetical protein
MDKQNEEWTSPQSYGFDRMQTSTMAWHKIRTWHNDKWSRGSRWSFPQCRLQNAKRFRHTSKHHQSIALTTYNLQRLWTVQSSQRTTHKA